MSNPTVTKADPSTKPGSASAGNSSSKGSSTRGRINPVRIVALVAKREIATSVRTKSFVISNVIVLALILGGIIGTSVFGGEDSRPKLGLVGGATSLSKLLSTQFASIDSPVDTLTVKDEATARSKVASGDLDVALVPRSTGSYTAVVDAKLPSNLRSVIDSTVRQQVVNSTLRARGVDPAAVARAAAAASLTVEAVNPPDPDSDQRTTIAYIAMFLMFFQVMIFGLAVAMGVVEEKSSRVVEVLLATIKPLHLLWGKVLGIGAVGLLELAAYGAVGLGAGMATGLITVTGVAIGVFASVLAWFILGFAFYSVAYAAAGSMVSRSEDVNATTTPITMVLMIGYVVAQFTVKEPDGMLAAVASWIPPFSAMLMPLRIAAGTTDLVQIVGSAVLMILATSALAMVAARIYERSVLLTGKRVSWGEALRSRA